MRGRGAAWWLAAVLWAWAVWAAEPVWDALSVLQGALNDADLRRRLLAEVRKIIAAHRDGPPLVLVTHGSVVSDLTGLDVRMGAFVVLRRGAE